MWAEPGFMISFWILCVTFYARSHQLQKGNGREIWISSRDKTCESFKRCWRRTWVCTEAQPAETGDRRKCLHISSSTKRSWITGKMHIHIIFSMGSHRYACGFMAFAICISHGAAAGHELKFNGIGRRCLGSNRLCST
uniref:Secreted protein n=1 Tax=Oryza punctata TaxID=4537 RepID=A0A0E0M1F6_ORYPU